MASRWEVRRAVFYETVQGLKPRAGMLPRAFARYLGCNMHLQPASHGRSVLRAIDRGMTICDHGMHAGLVAAGTATPLARPYSALFAAPRAEAAGPMILPIVLPAIVRASASA